MNIVLGLDLSSTCTGICLPDGQTEHFKPQGALLERALQTKRWVVDWVLPADLVVMEAIGTRHVQTAIALAYVHCQVDELLQGTRVLKVSPGELKKFATDKGNADKHAMTVAAMKAGWDSADSTDDECDSWWLWALGRHLLGSPVVEATKYRADVIEGLGWRPN